MGMHSTVIDPAAPPRWYSEMESLRLASGGVIHPQQVVDWAKANPNSGLHAQFEWDRDKAAMEHWLSQARALLRVRVRVESVQAQPFRALVSLQSDRSTGGGYRSTMDVLHDPVRRKELLAQALREAREWARRYRELEELAGVVAAVDELAA